MRRRRLRSRCCRRSISVCGICGLFSACAIMMFACGVSVVETTTGVNAAAGEGGGGGNVDARSTLPTDSGAGSFDGAVSKDDSSAGLGSCATLQPTAVFCADFEQAPLEIGWADLGSFKGTILTRDASWGSPAAHVKGATVKDFLYTGELAIGMRNTVSLSFRLYVGTTMTATANITSLTLNNTGYEVLVRLGPGGIGLHDSYGKDFVTVSVLPGGWIPVVVTLKPSAVAWQIGTNSTGSQNATTGIGGAVGAWLGAGLYYVEGANGQMDYALDDILVTATN